MEGEDSSGSGLYSPCMDVESRSCDGVGAAAVELQSVNECEPIKEMGDSQLVGVPVMVAVGSVAGHGEATVPVDVEVKPEVKVTDGDGGKRKRGRPPKGQAKPPPLKKKKEEEDVCFICFDGGSLVLCDRRGCPKAYHPVCIKRDEAFFRSRAKWNCGWHICSSCQKAAHYMCYTCTFSLCKACVKDADYLCVRENKGFCTTCMRTIMLIENNDQGNKEMAQVDFDDTSSWEYLFKVYWIVLKEKLSLTLDELTQAQNPWKAAGTAAIKARSLDVHYGGNDGKGSISDSTSGHLEANNSRRSTEEQPKSPNKGYSLSTDKSTSDNDNISVGPQEWASKELLELVAHMSNGDTSFLSHFDVQALLLDYIKRNNLCDPHQKGQIICDLRLRNLFGKPRVGHFEMLKLLEFHCLTKQDSQKDIGQANIVDAVVSKVEGDGENDNLPSGKHKKHKTCRKGDERGPQTNLDEYAAIDVHNINLIYLRRNLMESLIVDNGKFHDKVVGSFVRIRISSNDQNQDMYRLVQVVGTCKVAVPYIIGERTVDFMLEILNLDKKETISIDAVSNQEFSKDECRRLRQSIKCGIVERLTVGQVQQKAMALQEVRLNDWLEAEVMRLNHLRDRGSENGHKKELRECEEKLELLKTPEERLRRLQEIPEVHEDPNCESDEDPGVISIEKQDEYMKSRYSGFSRNGSEPISLQNGDISNQFGSRVWTKLSPRDQSSSMSAPFYLDKGAPSRVVERVNESLWNEGKEACGSNTFQKPGNQVDSTGSVVGGWNNQVGLGFGSEISVASLSTGSTPSEHDNETDKLWLYRDPNGKIQGPFCMVQLRKWSASGYFPPGMRIWGINDEEGDSLLMTDVLNGQFHKVLPLCISLPFQEVKGASDSRMYNCDGRLNGGMNSEEVARSNANNNEFMNGDGWGSHSSSLTRPVVNDNDKQMGSSSPCQDNSLKVKSPHSHQPQVHCPVPSFAFPEQSHEISLHLARGHEDQRWNSAPNHGERISHGNIIYQTTGGQSHENQSNSQGYLGKSSGFVSVTKSTDSSKYQTTGGQSHENQSNSQGYLGKSSGFVSVTKSTDSSKQIFGIDIPNLSSPMPKTSDGDLEGQTTKNQQSVPPNVHVQDLNIQNLPSPISKPSGGYEKADSSVQNILSPVPKADNVDEKVQATENNQSVSSNFLVQNSGPSWSSASSLMVGASAQLPEMPDKWDLGLVSVSSLKPHEVASNHAATPTSKCDELTTSLFHPASSWLALVTEPIEFSTLAEESVSDLLAEVDAMESQCGLASPTSVNCGEELFQDSKTDCFTSLRGLSPPRDSGKSDALSSTGDDRLPPQPAMTDERLGASSQGGVLDYVKRSGRKSSKSTEVEVETKPADVQVNQSEACSNSHLPAPSTMSRDLIDRDTDPRAGAKPIDTGRGTTHGNSYSGSGGSTRGITNTGSGTGQGTTRGNSNTNRGTPAGFTGRENHPKYVGERFMAPRDSDVHGGNSGFSRGRPSWSRQSSFGSGAGGGGGSGGSGSGGGSYSRPPSRGQRVCKFYESGHCRKGAFCDYLHP